MEEEELLGMGLSASVAALVAGADDPSVDVDADDVSSLVGPGEVEALSTLLPQSVSHATSARQRVRESLGGQAPPRPTQPKAAPPLVVNKRAARAMVRRLRALG